MSVSSVSRPVLALALALASAGLASQPAAALEPALQTVGWHGYGHGPGVRPGHFHRPPPRVYVPPPRYVYVPPPRYVYVPPPVAYRAPTPCWRLPPWHPAACLPPPRVYRHW